MGAHRYGIFILSVPNCSSYVTKDTEYITWINISIWATATKLLSIDCCWVRGGVGGQLPRY